LVKQDHAGVLRFAPLQGETFASVLQVHPELGKLDSVVFRPSGEVGQEQVYTRSSAALRAIAELGGVWRMAKVFLVVPDFVRDAVYRFVASVRYKIFGRVDACEIPSPDVVNRLLP